MKYLTPALIALAVSVAVSAGETSEAKAHVFVPKCKSLKCIYQAQTKSLDHAMYVAKRGSGQPQRWHHKSVVWLKKEVRRTEEKLHPTNWRTYLLRLVGPVIYNSCALPLIGRESGGSVTRWNGRGSGAYGLGQALPASKMKRYGSDYMTNGVTQIRWMNDYVRKYGGWCGANAFQLANNWY